MLPFAKMSRGNLTPSENCSLGKLPTHQKLVYENFAQENFPLENFQTKKNLRYYFFSVFNEGNFLSILFI